MVIGEGALLAAPVGHRPTTVALPGAKSQFFPKLL